MFTYQCAPSYTAALAVSEETGSLPRGPWGGMWQRSDDGRLSQKL